MAAKKVNKTAVARIDVGDRLPAFELADQDGNHIKSSQLEGRRLVLYFYPKDDTPGCTQEACSFQENLNRLEKMKVQVVGVSSDSSERHRKFADKYHLGFPLLVDADRALANACGVIGEKVLYGRTSLGVVRTTLIVDESGVVRRVFRKVKVGGHTEEVIQALEEL
jgi:thioredoxin-dependent peroxiredoxin